MTRISGFRAVGLIDGLRGHIGRSGDVINRLDILRNVRTAAGSEATILLVEMVIPEHDHDFMGKRGDLEMLLCGNGRERTTDEYRNLLRQSGLQMTRVLQTASPYSVVEARATAK